MYLTYVILVKILEILVIVIDYYLHSGIDFYVLLNIWSS